MATFVTLTEVLQCKYIACLKNVYYLLLFFTYKKVLSVNFGVNFTVPFYLGPSVGLSSAPVDLLYDYLGLQFVVERSFEVLICQLINVKQ